MHEVVEHVAIVDVGDPAGLRRVYLPEDDSRDRREVARLVGVLRQHGLISRDEGIEQRGVFLAMSGPIDRIYL